MNKAMVIGRLGADPDVRTMPSGDTVATLSIATNERFKDAECNKQERTEWHRVVTFGAMAKVAADYLAKGRLIMTEGRLRTRKWNDKDGVTRYTTEIVAQRLEMLDSAIKAESPKAPAPDTETYNSEEVPF